MEVQIKMNNYLLNDFNHYIVKYEANKYSTFLDTLAINLFYLPIFGMLVANTITMYQEENENVNKPIENDKSVLYNLNENENCSQDNNFINDSLITGKDKKTILDNLTNINCIYRCYILYYIFKEKGVFFNKVKNTYCNSYDDFLEVRNRFGGEEEFNLDETIPNTGNFIKFTIDDKEYELPIAHLRFVSWVHYSGLYDYLMQNSSIKSLILNKMMQLKLFNLNYFLQYILIDANNYVNNYANTDNNYSDYETETEETNDGNEVGECEMEEVDTEDDEREDDEEIEKFRNNQSHSNFLNNLMNSIYSLTARGYINFQEEIIEMIKPRID